jgi:hypothetical protein
MPRRHPLDKDLREQKIVREEFRKLADRTRKVFDKHFHILEAREKEALTEIYGKCQWLAGEAVTKL